MRILLVLDNSLEYKKCCNLTVLMKCLKKLKFCTFSGRCCCIERGIDRKSHFLQPHRSMHGCQWMAFEVAGLNITHTDRNLFYADFIYDNYLWQLFMTNITHTDQTFFCWQFFLWQRMFQWQIWRWVYFQIKCLCDPKKQNSLAKVIFRFSVYETNENIIFRWAVYETHWKHYGLSKMIFRWTVYETR